MGKFVEFFGPGVSQLSIADRATIANMCPEYGGTVGFFPVDDLSVKYLTQTGKKLLRYYCIDSRLNQYVNRHIGSSKQSMWQGRRKKKKKLQSLLGQDAHYPTLQIPIVVLLRHHAYAADV